MSITKSLPAASEFQPGRRNGLRSHGLSFEWTRREETLKKVSELDGIYVIRTSEPGGLLPAEDTVRKIQELVIASEPHTAQSVTGETPVPRWLRGMAVPAMIQT